MISDRKKPGVAFWATLTFVVLSLYPIAYLVLMEPIWTIPYFGADWERYPRYKVPYASDEIATSLFRLGHRIDRRVRPDFWSERKPYRGEKQP